MKLEGQDKKILIYFVFLAAITTTVIIYMNYQIGNPLVIEGDTTKDTFVKIVNVKKEDIFNTMTNLSNYPKVLPQSYVSIKIINQTSNTIYAEEEVTEIGIKTKMLVRHTIIPYDKHVFEVLDGDANGTKITEIFDGNGSSTKITTTLEMHLHGWLAPLSFLPKSNLEHDMDTIITSFVEYTK